MPACMRGRCGWVSGSITPSLPRATWPPALPAVTWLAPAAATPRALSKELKECLSTCQHACECIAACTTHSQSMSLQAVPCHTRGAHVHVPWARTCARGHAPPLWYAMLVRSPLCIMRNDEACAHVHLLPNAMAIPAGVDVACMQLHVPRCGYAHRHRQRWKGRVRRALAGRRVAEDWATPLHSHPRASTQSVACSTMHGGCPATQTCKHAYRHAGRGGTLRLERAMHVGSAMPAASGRACLLHQGAHAAPMPAAVDSSMQLHVPSCAHAHRHGQRWTGRAELWLVAASEA